MIDADRAFAEALRNAIDEYLARRRGAGQAGAGDPGGHIPNVRPASEATWLTVEEATAYLGLRSRMALYQAVRRGQVRAHYLGRRLRFRRTELDEQLSRR
jgi:excisionase family DNA binding protein